MIKSRYFFFLLLNMIFVPSFIVFNNIFFYIDLILVIFLIFSYQYQEKYSWYYIFLSGILFDFVYPKFAGLGILIFFIVNLIKNFFSWMWNLSSSGIKFFYFITAIICYKILNLIFFGGDFKNDLYVGLLSFLITLFVVFIIDFIFGIKRCFSDT